MSLSGTWNMNVQSPMGAQAMTLNIEEADDGGLTGKASSPVGEAELTGKHDGDSIEFGGTVQSPMGAVELTFTGKVDGEALSGEASFGSFGSGSWEASRA